MLHAGKNKIGGPWYEIEWWWNSGECMEIEGVYKNNEFCQTAQGKLTSGNFAWVKDRKHPQAFIIYWPNMFAPSDDSKACTPVALALFAEKRYRFEEVCICQTLNRRVNCIMWSYLWCTKQMFRLCMYTWFNMKPTNTVPKNMLCMLWMDTSLVQIEKKKKKWISLSHSIK